MNFSEITNSILQGLEVWEPILSQLSEETISNKHNRQGRSIRQVLGHMVDSASNNMHRIIHLQYQERPVQFPNYASNRNNDRWIAIQDYQNENRHNLLQHWKYSHLHLVHVIGCVNPGKLEKEWFSGSEHGNITLRDMITDFLRHFNLHLTEIQELMDTN